MIIDFTGHSINCTNPERLDSYRSMSLLSNFFYILSYLGRGELAIGMDNIDTLKK